MLEEVFFEESGLIQLNTGSEVEEEVSEGLAPRLSRGMVIVLT